MLVQRPIKWLDRRKEDISGETGYEYKWKNVTLAMWIPGHSQLRYVQLSAVFDALPSVIKQNAISLLGLLQTLEGESSDISFRLDIPKKYKPYYTLVGAEDTTVTEEQKKQRLENLKPFVSGPLYDHDASEEYSEETVKKVSDAISDENPAVVWWKQITAEQRANDCLVHAVNYAIG